MRIRKALKMTVILTATIFALAACGAARQALVQSESAPGAKTSFALTEDIVFSAEAESVGAQSSPADRMVIYNADMTMVVADPLASIERVSALAAELGGFVVQSDVFHTETLGAEREAQAASAPEAHITIRVLAEELDEAIARLSEMAVDVRNLSRRGRDVTQEYTDLSSRLHNMEAAEAQLLAIMEAARRSEDVLEVFRELVRLREQIEVLRGQMQYYEQSARLSALSVQLLPDAGAQPISVRGWKPIATLKRATETLLRGLRALGDILIFAIVTVLPIALIMMTPLFFGGRALLRMRKSRKRPPQHE